MDSENPRQDILIGLVREVSKESVGYVVGMIEKGLRKFSCSMLLLVTSEKMEETAEEVVGKCRERLGLDDDRLMVVPESELVGSLPNIADSVVYLVLDTLKLPKALEAVPKQLLGPSSIAPDGEVAEVEMIPWPAGMAASDLTGTPPAWTRHFFAESHEMRKQLARVRTVLRHPDLPGMPANLLITGQTGAGKSYFAKCLPLILSPKYDNPLTPFDPDEPPPKNVPWVAGNCASLSPELADALLFGAVKGAYTGCDQDKMGLIESAGNGILFLDEVGELPPQTQSKLLTALEERRFCRLGDTGRNRKVIDLKCFIVFGTNVDLSQAVGALKATGGQRGFREDLYYRINACHLRFPSFAERIAGGSALGEEFINTLVQEACARFDLQLTNGAETAFKNFARTNPWRGNYRDLQHIFQALKIELVMQDMGRIVSAHLMENTLEGTLRDSDSQESESWSELHRQIRGGKTPSVQKDVDRIFAVCAGAVSCADAGRIYYGADRKGNPSDVFAKHLRSRGLAFDPASPEHLKPIKGSN